MVAFQLKVSQIIGVNRLVLLGQTFYAQAPNGFQTQSIRHLSLAYALHEPSKIEMSKSSRAIIIMHGLFGSKQNNRSISKYGSLGASPACVTLKRTE